MHHEIGDLWLPPMLALVDASTDRVGCVALLDLHIVKEEYRTTVILRRHEMHTDGGVRDFSASECFHDCFVHMVTVHAGSTEIWQWPRMDVESDAGVESSNQLQPPRECEKLRATVFRNPLILVRGHG